MMKSPEKSTVKWLSCEIHPTLGTHRSDNFGTLFFIVFIWLPKKTERWRLSGLYVKHKIVFRCFNLAFNSKLRENFFKPLCLQEVLILKSHFLKSAIKEHNKPKFFRPLTSSRVGLVITYLDQMVPFCVVLNSLINSCIFRSEFLPLFFSSWQSGTCCFIMVVIWSR